MRLRRSRETLSVFLIEIKEFKEFEERSQNPESRSQEVHGAIHVWEGLL